VRGSGYAFDETFSLEPWRRRPWPRRCL